VDTRNPTTRDLRNFGFMLGGAIAGIFGVGIPLLLGHGLPVWPWAAGGVFVAWALVAPGTLAPVFRAWMAFGEVMNFVMSRVILGVVFFLVVFPTGLILRLRGRDPMRRKRESDAASYRVASRGQDPKQMEKPF
jgi:hypothetical protein